MVLRGLDADPIEMSQQDIKEQLRLEISPGGVGTCELLLDRATGIKNVISFA